MQKAKLGPGRSRSGSGGIQFGAPSGTEVGREKDRIILPDVSAVGVRYNDFSSSGSVV